MSDTACVRAARLTDYVSVCRLLDQLHPGDRKVENAQSLKIFEEILVSHYFEILVAESRRSIQGTCYLNVIPNLTRSAAPYAIIENVVVDETHRHKGIGRSLVKAAITRALNRECYKVMLMTGRDAGIQDFYESCGMKAGKKVALITRL